MAIKKFFKDFVDITKNLYEVEGISEILKQEYKTYFGSGYVFYLLEAAKNKTIVPDKEAEDSLLVLKCKEEFGDQNEDF
ncbi:MAG: hypothetical protein N3G19_02995 [Candidatus Pacearchaeota archaeon]|nr:hypothetical protein [Candidatus Pacearchaeota archaeon]